MFDAPIGIVRPQWNFELAHACQRFAGAALDADPDLLVRAVDDLAKALPAAHSQAERFVLRDRLRIVADSAGRQFHAQFHRQVQQACRQATNDSYAALSWDEMTRGPGQLLQMWVRKYLEDFSGSHECPAPMRAARMIRCSFQKPLDLERIAREVSFARSGLIRAFKETYGISMGGYQTRCRIASAVHLLRAPDSNVGAAAFHVGYQSTKNLYRALRWLTGLTPSEVRSLSDEAAGKLLANIAPPAATCNSRRRVAVGREKPMR